MGSQRVTCGADSITGTTVGEANDVTYYAGCPWEESGPEVVYQLKVPFGGLQIDFTLEQFASDLDLFLLTDCDEGTCVEWGGTGLSWTFPEPGTYYLVVDGYTGDQGPFALWIDCVGVPDIIFCVRFYEHIPRGDRAGPGAMLYEYWTEDYHEVAEPSGIYSYWADIPPFPVTAGEHYWVSFQCVSSWDDTAQWGMAQSVDFELMSPFMDFDLLGAPRWTSFLDPPLQYSDTDLAFELFADPTPVERTSWTTIKSMYR
ncbi:MAG: hypothetical protein GF400_00575 [Candidatus Eisenbacteria bacterium]|nr:hypothetical protein [Candidatus Eisenbacteria bacterium]